MPFTSQFPKPTVVVTSTKSGGPGWLTSGTVEFTITADHSAPASLKFDFHNAQNEQHAIQQAATELQQVAAAFAQLAKTHLTGG